MTEELKTNEMPTMPEASKGAEQPMSEHQALLAELEKLGVQKPEQLQGMVAATQQTGNLANMVGELRKGLDKSNRENEALRMMLQEFKQNKPQHDPYDTQPVNIEEIVERSMSKFYENKILKPQQEAQQQFARELSKVQGDDHFRVIGPTFEEYVRNPKVQYAISTGETSLLDEWHRFKDRYFTNLLGKVTENYRSLLETGARGAGKVAPPHMESSGSTNYVPPESTPDIKGQLKDLASKSRGQDADIDAMLKKILPDGDPVLRRR